MPAKSRKSTRGKSRSRTRSSGRSRSTASKRSSRTTQSKSRGRRTSSGRKKAATTRAGKFVKKEMEHARHGKHPVKSRKQAIAIGLSKARRAGVKVPAKGRRSTRSSKRR